MIIYTRRASSLFATSLIIFFVALFLLIALINKERDLAVLSLLVIALTCALKIWSHFSIESLKTGFTRHKNRIFVDEKLSLTLKVENRKFLPVCLEISIPARQFSTESGADENGLTGRGSLLWYQNISFQWQLKALSRGVHEIGPARIMSGDLFGFYVKETDIHKVFDVIVYPRLVELNHFPIPKRDFFGLPGGKSPVDDPVYILGTEDYHYGRPAKHIHWKASARHSRLQEKIFESSHQEKVLIAIDTDQFADSGQNEAFERMLEVAASLAVRFNNDGCALGFLTNGLMTKSGSCYIQVARNPGQTGTILEAMAKIKMESRESMIDMLRHSLNLAWGTSCVYFTIKEDREIHYIKGYFARRKIPVSVLSFDRAAALRKDGSGKEMEINIEKAAAV